ncbi:MAG: DUF4912 domain-containing protein [Candidatus Hydrogenedentota bacterium]|nr:MAG: DUF4912 domain-containing protein [Candidatus Hydrogenedentota bacterium]
MDEQKLMRKTKSELLKMLKSRRLKTDPKAKKKDIVSLLLKSERSSRSRTAEKGKAKKRTKKAAVPRRTKERKPGAEAVRAARQRGKRPKYPTEKAPPETITEAPPVPGTPEHEEPSYAPYPTELPKRYGQDRIVAMVRDPYWIFAYWEVTPESLQRARRELGAEADGASTVLRVYDITGIAFTGENANSLFDIEVVGGADNWYINTGWPNRSYCVDIGLLSPQGRYYTLARSNAVHTPRAGMSEEVDERWMSLEEEFERIYALSGGFQIGEGSLELREMMEKQLQMQLASEAIGSLFSMAVPHKERGFWFVVNTELIVYGATQPGATVTIQGKPVTLRPDGTFSTRFALPDGKQVIPVTAESRDGRERRTITPTITRTTSASEPVLHE